MLFSLVFPGKTRSPYLREGITDFRARLARFVEVEFVSVRDQYRRNLSEATIRSREAAGLLAASDRASMRVALDPDGNQPDSEELAGLITSWQEGNIRTVAFLLGGHLGLDQEVLQRADLVLSLSRLTFTHEMSRLILLEQLYRAWTIKAGHGYHK